jgi:hypothetical protein
MRRVLLLTAAVLAAGCDAGSPAKPAADKAKADEVAKREAHEHANAPHGGALVEWGEEEYHPEFTVDHPTKTATVYILGPDAQRPKAIDAKSITLTLKLTPAVTLTLTPKPQETDPPGRSSRFVGTHDALGVEREFAGTITGTAGGKNYTGDFKEEPHEHKK